MILYMWEEKTFNQQKFEVEMFFMYLFIFNWLIHAIFFCPAYFFSSLSGYVFLIHVNDLLKSVLLMRVFHL